MNRSSRGRRKTIHSGRVFAHGTTPDALANGQGGDLC
jgi:hypothetical protein